MAEMPVRHFSERAMNTKLRIDAPTVTRRLARDESGQIMMITGLLMVVMLVAVALVIDIGHAQLVQRQLQAGVDAAALAAAQELPDAAAADQTGHDYSPSAGDKNAVNTIRDATTTVETRCIVTIPGCNTRYGSTNAVTVQSVANVPTFFGRIVGVNHLTVRARATACYPCAVRPLDIMLVLDRTASMDATELANAKEGIKAFVGLMDPKLDRVGLAVLPPAIGPAAWSYQDGQPCLQWRSGRPHTDANCTKWTQVKTPTNNNTPSNVCSAPDQNNSYYGYDAWSPWWQWTLNGSDSYGGQDRAFYTVVSLSDDDVDNNPNDDYVTKDAQGNWDLNDNSPIISTLDCIQGGGSTSYQMAIDDAQHELELHGRSDVQNVIVFFTDGGANTSATKLPTNYWSSSWTNKPCGGGVEAANRAKQRDLDGAGPLSGTIIYTIGYGIQDHPNSQERCNKPDSNGHANFSNSAENGITPIQALTQMASIPQDFYRTADSAELRIIFTRIAGDVLTNAARLVDNNLPDLTQ
jgi:Flp pilus assembly protein TadG